MTSEAEMLAQEKLGAKEMALREKKPTSKGKTGDTKGSDTGPLDRLGIISKKVAGLIPHFSHRVLRDDAAHFERSIPSREEANELIDSEAD